MNKEMNRKLKLNLPGGQVTPATIGKDLAPTGINLSQFTAQYNELTRRDIGRLIPAKVTIYDDRSFTIQVTTPPTAFLIKEALGITKGAANPGKEFVGTLTKAQVAAIAQVKLPDLNTTSLAAAEKMIAGTAKNMGVLISEL